MLRGTRSCSRDRHPWVLFGGDTKWRWRHRTEARPLALHAGRGRGGGVQGGERAGVGSDRAGLPRRPTEWELARRVHRGYRLGCCHFDPALAKALESALAGAGGAAGAARTPPGRPPEPLVQRAAAVSACTRSFVGSLARLPEQRLAEVAAALEVFTFAALLGAWLRAPGGGTPQALRRQWEQARDRYRRMGREQMACEAVLGMRRRLPVRTAGSPPQLEAFLNALVAHLAAGYGLKSRTAGPELLQDTLVAAARDGMAVARGLSAGWVERQGPMRWLAAGLALGALGAAGCLGRHRLSLTVATILYVVTTTLFGITLPFDAYRWVAVAIELCLQPPAVAASLVGAESLLYARCRARFDGRLLAAILVAIYQIAPAGGDGADASVCGCAPGLALGGGLAGS